MTSPISEPSNTLDTAIKARLKAQEQKANERHVDDKRETVKQDNQKEDTRAVQDSTRTANAPGIGRKLDVRV